MNNAIGEKIIQTEGKRVGNIHKRWQADLCCSAFDVTHVRRRKPDHFRKAFLRQLLLNAGQFDALAERLVIDFHVLSPSFIF